jgi:hypothetical protein
MGFAAGRQVRRLDTIQRRSDKQGIAQVQEDAPRNAQRQSSSEAVGGDRSLIVPL